MSRTAIHDIVASDLAEPGEEIEDVPVIAKHAAVVSIAGVKPVVAESTEDTLGPLSPVHEDVAPGATEVLTPVVPAEQEVVPGAAQQNVSAEPGSGSQGIVAVAPLEDIVAVASEEDVVAVATEQRVVAFAPFNSIVAIVTVEGVVTDVRPQPVVTGGPPGHEAVSAGQRGAEPPRPTRQPPEPGGTRVRAGYD